MNRPTPPNSQVCFICGPTHPDGLRLQINSTPDSDGDRAVIALPDFVAGRVVGSAHPGIVTCLLDDMISHVILDELKANGMTVNIKTSIHQPVPLNRALGLSVNIESVNGRKVVAMGEVRLKDERTILASGVGMFIIIKENLAS